MDGVLEFMSDKAGIVGVSGVAEPVPSRVEVKSISVRLRMGLMSVG